MATGRSYTTKGYCDITDVENYLLLTIDSSFDEQVNDWIATAEKMVDDYLGYTTASGILREEVSNERVISHIDSDGNLMVFPRKTPIASVTSISLVKGSESIDLTLTNDSGDTKYNIPATNDYILYPSYELSVTGTSTLGSFSSISRTKFFAETSYIGGFETVPSPIRQATVNFVSDMVQRHSNKEGLSGISQGRVSKRWANRTDGHSDFYLDAIALLNPYRLTNRFV